MVWIIGHFVSRYLYVACATMYCEGLKFLMHLVRDVCIHKILFVEYINHQHTLVYHLRIITEKSHAVAAVYAKLRESGRSRCESERVKF